MTLLLRKKAIKSLLPVLAMAKVEVELGFQTSQRDRGKTKDTDNDLI